jgi:hypothetical protein
MRIRLAVWNRLLCSVKWHNGCKDGRKGMTLGLAHFVSVEQVYGSSSGHAVDAGMGSVDEDSSLQGVKVCH